MSKRRKPRRVWRVRLRHTQAHTNENEKECVAECHTKDKILRSVSIEPDDELARETISKTKQAFTQNEKNNGEGREKKEQARMKRGKREGREKEKNAKKDNEEKNGSKGKRKERKGEKK